MENYKVVRELDRKEWSDFVYNHPDGNIFQTPGMFEVYKNTKNYEPVFLAVKENNDIVGILLAVIQKEHSGFLGKFSSRSIIWGGPLVKDNDEKVFDLLLKEYKREIKKKAIYTQFRNLWEQGDNKRIFDKCGFKYEEHLNIINDLTLDKEILWKNLAKSRREGIRKAQRNNLIFGFTNSKEIIPTFYNLLSKTYKHAKLPYPKIDFFYSLHKKFSSNNLKFFTLCKDNEILIILAALIYNKCLYAFYIGTIRDNHYLKMRPVDLFYWEVLCWAKENACNTYDWLGAGKPDKEYGVRKFKLQYGGKVTELGRYEKVHKPLLMGLGKLGLKLWQKIK